jgi:hypothetical protein
MQAACMKMAAERERRRHVAVMATPRLWPTWPVLCVVKGRLPDVECGVMYDVMGTGGRPGYSATVYLTNVFTLPDTLDELLQLPKVITDTAEELYDAGWRVD